MASEHFQTLTHTAVKSWANTLTERLFICFKMSFYFCHMMYLEYNSPIILFPSCYIHMTFFFFQGPNSSFPICTYIHAHPHTHSLIDTLRDHTHSHVTHTHHVHTCTHTHSQIQSTSMHNHTDTTHTYTPTRHTSHTHAFTQTYTTGNHRHTPHTSKYLSTQPGTEVIRVNKTDQTAFPPRAYIKSKEKLKKI